MGIIFRMREPKNENQTSYVACSEEDLKLENERGFIMSALTCDFTVREIADMAEEIWIAEVLAESLLRRFSAHEIADLLEGAWMDGAVFGELDYRMS